VGPENDDLSRHGVLRAKGRRIRPDDQKQRVCIERDVWRKVESEAVQPPGIGGRGRIEQRDRLAREVPQFDELVIADIRMIVNLADDDGADDWPRVDVAQGVRRLRGEIVLTGAQTVAPKGYPALRRPEAET